MAAAMPSNSHAAPRNEGDYGCKVLHDPSEAVADIVFIHGLTGNRSSTWTKEIKTKTQTFSCCWPEDLLPEDVTNARIITWGYDADVVDPKLFHMVSNNSIEEHATSLCTELANLRSRAPERPIIFVTHSLGGLVCKSALLHASEANSNDTSHIHEIYKHARGIIFMGTPHEGSSHAKLGSILASILSIFKKTNKDSVKALSENARSLVSLQERFYRLLNSRRDEGRPLYITCFFEELDVPVIGLIVTKDSASMHGYEAIGIHANHIDMTKFLANDGAGYQKVKGELVRWVQNLDYAAGGKESRSGNVYHYGNVTDEAVGIYGSPTFSGTTHIGGQTNSGAGTFNAGGQNYHYAGSGSGQ